MNGQERYLDPNRVAIGAWVHPVMARRRVFEEVYGVDYRRHRDFVRSFVNWYHVDIQGIRYHAERVVNERLRELRASTFSTHEVIMMYSWIQNRTEVLNREIYIDVLLAATAPLEKKASIEFYLSHKYGYHHESLEMLNRHAYRL